MSEERIYLGTFYGADAYGNQTAKLAIEFLQGELERARQQHERDLQTMNDLAWGRANRNETSAIWKLWKWGGA